MNGSAVEGKIREVRERVRTLPRARVAHVPTPLEACPNLTAAVGGPSIHVKREDCTGLAFGGNKTRQLELVLGTALESGCDYVVHGADAQSNHARQLAAAAARVGLHATILLEREDPTKGVQGNHRLTRLLGQDVRIIEPTNDMAARKEEVAEELRARGHRPYVVGRGARESLVLAAVAYVEALMEIAETMLSGGDGLPQWIYTCSQGSTQAGLAVGVRLLELDARVVGINPVKASDDGYLSEDDIRGLANEAADRLGYPLELSAADICNSTAHVGPGFGEPSPDGMRALRLMARTEGCLLDPIYTSKALAALIQDSHAAALMRDETVVFVHTGGTPALFADDAVITNAEV